MFLSIFLVPQGVYDSSQEESFNFVMRCSACLALVDWSEQFITYFVLIYIISRLWFIDEDLVVVLRFTSLRVGEGCGFFLAFSFLECWVGGFLATRMCVGLFH